MRRRQVHMLLTAQEPNTPDLTFQFAVQNPQMHLARAAARIFPWLGTFDELFEIPTPDADLQDAGHPVSGIDREVWRRAVN
jgi:hypothetical protein